MTLEEALPIVARIIHNKLGLGLAEREALRLVLEAASKPS